MDEDHTSIQDHVCAINVHTLSEREAAINRITNELNQLKEEMRHIDHLLLSLILQRQQALKALRLTPCTNIAS